MKNFFQAGKFNLIFTAVATAVAALVNNYVIEPWNLGYALGKFMDLFLSPVELFGNFGLWIMTLIDPAVEESGEAITFQLTIIRIFIVWPLALIYFYLVGTLLSKIALLFNKNKL